ncbi:hypothetical protein [Micromonospora echinospora]|uniref:hypothetical protein n=1 Tax=Micromonospora echinospora TaxID=1877 RepID=UPI003A892397
MLETVIAAADEPSRGWGGPIALLIVVIVYVTGATIHAHFMPDEDPSPTERGARGVSVKQQVRAVSDTDDTTPDTDWWGRIVNIGGRRVRVYDQPAADGEVDVALDDDEADEEETIEDVIAGMLDRGHQYAEIVRHVMEEFEVSEATAKRRIRDVRAERIAAAS